MKIWKDTLIGVFAGVVAAGALMLRRTDVQIPPGLYQAQLDRARYRETADLLRGPAGPSAVQQKLLKSIEEVKVKDVPLENALAYLGELTGTEIRVDRGELDAARVPANVAVSVELAKTTGAAALREALSSAGRLGTRLAYQVEPDHVRVSTYAALTRETITRAYDIRDIVRGMVERDRALLAPPRVPPGVQSPTGQTPMEIRGPVPLGWSKSLFESYVRRTARFGEFVTTPLDAVDQLVKTLETHIDSKSWREAGGEVGYIYYFAGKLLVVQTRQNQEEIATWLEWIRQEVKQ